MRLKMTKQYTYLLFAFFLFSCFSLNANEEKKEIHWLINYEEAIELSRTEEKPVFMLFTGSDWCGWCMKLESEVFASDAFRDAMADTFVFLKLDFPRKIQQTPEIKKQNKRLMREYPVRGFPTVILLNSKNQQIGSTGYKRGGGAAYVEHIQKMMSEPKSDA
tara:strand:- start:73 stop:558 length:486 start_codon:yes stop_codon:yes gene_type:complete